MTRITIEPIDYHYVNSAQDFTAPNQILKGFTAVESFQNAKKAINQEAGEGTYYSTGTTAHPTVDASASGARLTVTAKNNGEAGNNIRLSELAVAITANQMSGGADNQYATGYLIFTQNPYDHKIFIGNETVRITSSLTDDYDSQIAGSVSATMSNVATTNNFISELASANSSSNEITYTLLQPGAAGNLITCGTNSSVLSFSSSTFTGGANALAAENSLFFENNPANGNFVYISDPDLETLIAYKFVSVVAQAYDVLIGLNLIESIANLFAAINASGTAGINYGIGTVAHTFVFASTSDPTTLTVTAKVASANGNNCNVSADSDGNFSWQGEDGLIGGADSIAATAVLTASSNPQEFKVTIGQNIHTFSDYLNNEYDIKIKETAEETALGLYNCLDIGPGSSSDYVASQQNPHVTAIDVFSDENNHIRFSFRSRVVGSPGNAIPIISNSSLITASGASLSGGVNESAASGSFVINVDSGVMTGMIPSAPKTVRAPVIL